MGFCPRFLLLTDTMKLLLLSCLAAAALAHNADYTQLQFAQFKEQFGKTYLSSATSHKPSLSLCTLVVTSVCRPPQLSLSPSPILPRTFPQRWTGGRKVSSLKLRTKDSAALAGLSAPPR